MKQLKNIAIHAATYVLLCAIVFPSVLQFSHLFEAHEHSFCGNVTTHLHEQDVDCDFTNFLLPLATNYIFEFVEEKIFVQDSTLSFYYKAPIELGISQFIRARGPPRFQQYTFPIFC